MDAVQSTAGLAYRRSGVGPPVVLVHGIPGSARGWGGVEAHLAAVADVIAPDLIGFGSSPAPRTMTADVLGPAAQASALEALLDEIGIRAAVLVGHDFGVPISTLVAARRPDQVAALFVMAGNTFPDAPIPFPLSLTTLPLIGPLAARALFSGPSLRLMLRQGTGAGSPPPDPAIHLGSPTQRAAIASIFADALARLAERYAPVEQALRSVEAPVLVGWGDRDPFFPLEQGRRTAEVAGGRLHIFPGAGHFLPHERPLEVAQQIEAIIGDLP